MNVALLEIFSYLATYILTLFSLLLRNIIQLNEETYEYLFNSNAYKLNKNNLNVKIKEYYSPFFCCMIICSKIKHIMGELIKR